VIKTAFVLGAGLGTRLRPLTEVRPKPLVPVCSKPLVAYAFDHLIAHGIERFVVNTHWLPDVWPQVFSDARYRRSALHFRHEPDILETAGGIKNVEDLLGGETFIVYNGDILTDLPLAPAMRAHRDRGHEVTLVLRSKDGPLQVAWNAETGRVTDIGGRLGASEPLHLFTGVYIVEPAFLARIPPREKISVIPLFLEMIRSGAALGGVVIDDGMWWDLGTREKYLEVHRHFAQTTGVAPWIADDAEVHPSASVTGASVIGSGARVGANAKLVDTIVWPGAVIGPGAELNACVVTGVTPIAGHHFAHDL
jgi:NDP-sugar pyrophosphorylase family protein